MKWFHVIFCYFHSSKEIQYSKDNIDRELNKAYIGFFNEDEGAEPSCVATGNWGCGAFGGKL